MRGDFRHGSSVTQGTGRLEAGFRGMEELAPFEPQEHVGHLSPAEKYEQVGRPVAAKSSLGRTRSASRGDDRAGKTHGPWRRRTKGRGAPTRCCGAHRVGLAGEERGAPYGGEGPRGKTRAPTLGITREGGPVGDTGLRMCVGGAVVDHLGTRVSSPPALCAPAPSAPFPQPTRKSVFQPEGPLFKDVSYRPAGLTSAGLIYTSIPSSGAPLPSSVGPLPPSDHPSALHLGRAVPCAALAERAPGGAARPQCTARRCTTTTVYRPLHTLHPPAPSCIPPLLSERTPRARGPCRLQLPSSARQGGEGRVWLSVGARPPPPRHHRLGGGGSARDRARERCHVTMGRVE